MNDTTQVVTHLAARILVIDDNQAIHQDFRKIFSVSRERSTPSAAELALFGDGARFAGVPEFQVDSAYQGQEGLALARLAREQRNPYAMAFVDVRMPPGWDGVETTARIWEHDPDIQIVICTAYSDYSWSEMLAKLGRSDRLVILKKPFDTIEVVQLASALTEKWRLARQSRSIMEDLERRVAERTRELVQAGEQLQASEAQYRLLFDSNPHPMWVYDTETLRFVTVNGAAVEHYGYSEHQFLAMTVLDIRQTEDVAAPEKDVDELQGQGKAFAKLRHRKQDGSLIEVEISSDRIVFNGRPARLVLSHDVTERNRAVEELRRNESLKGAILESSLDCLLAIDHDGKIVEFNPAAETTFGLTRQQALGREMVDLIVPPRLRDGHRRGFAKYLATGIGPILGQRRELAAIRADGTEFPIELAVTPLRGISTPMFTGFIRDITARKEAEGKIKRLNRVYAVLSGINTLIVRVHDREELFKEACRIAVEEGNFGIAWIGSFDPATLDVTPVAWAGLGAQEYLGNARSTARDDLPEGLGAVGRAIRELRPVFSNDSSTEPGIGSARGKEALAHDYHSLIALPLIAGGAAVGTLALFAKEADFFDDEEVRLLTQLAGDISFALEHINAQQKVDKLSRIRAVSSEINAAISRVRDPQELLNATCNIAVEQAGFPLIWIGMLDPVTQDLKPAAMAGVVLEYAKLMAPTIRADTPAGEGTNGRAFREKKPIVENDMTARPNKGFLRCEALKRGIQAAMSLPLLVEGTPVGVMGFYAREKGYFDDEEVTLLTEVAGDISFALENIHRQQKIDKLSRIRTVSREINAAIVRIRERKPLLEEACRIMSEHGKFEMTWIGTTDHAMHEIRPVAWAGFSDEAAHAVSWTSISSTKGTIGEAMQSRRPSVRNTVEASSAGGNLRREALARGFRSSLCLPLIVDDEVAALIVLFASGQGFFDKDELALLEGVASDISFALQAIDRQERLDYIAYYDVLTSLANRSLFLERVESYMRSAVSGAHKLALFLIDLERFKNINDSLGQPAGDALLRQVADWLTRHFGDAHLLARVDSDHFAVVCPEVHLEEDAARILQKMMAAFLDHSFRLNDGVFRLGAKVGVAVFPDDGAQADTLFKNAEAALKKAKASGDRYLFYTQAMTEMVAGKLNLENHLRQALEREEFVLHFQPKVTLDTGEISGFEALLRWQPPEGGLVQPDQFIPLLEETGIIIPVGEWVVRQACRQVKAWTDARVRPVPIAVNLSARQIHQQDVCAMAARMLREHGVPPRLIEFEITESAAMQNAEASIAALQALKKLGVRLSIDDFGTGYSSLSYLKRLPIDTVKIDRSFVTDLATNPDDASIAQAIINMAHNLNLQVVAEGVETESQLSFLTSHGCDQMQGYYFSRPVPAPEATAMLAQSRHLQRPGASPGDGERTLLLLDDELPILSSLKRLLRRDNYQILTATSAAEAFELLALHKVGVIVSDHRMPEMTGVEFLRRVKELYPRSVRMALSGYTDLDSVTEAVNQGAIYRFLTKPWDDRLLRSHIAEAFRQYAKLQAVELDQEEASARIAVLTLANGLLEKTLTELAITPQVSGPELRRIQEKAP